MEHTAFITGGDRGFGFALCTKLLEQGWQVFAGQYMPEWPDLSNLAGQYPQALHIISLDVNSIKSVQSAALAVEAFTDHIDLLINNAGVNSPTINRTIREPQDYTEMHRLYDVNALGPLRVVETFLPLTDRSKFKRLCFVSSEAGSITRAERTAWYAYCMSKSALNMGVKILFNSLHHEGYSFRVYHPGWICSYISGKKCLEADLTPTEAAAKAIPIFLSQRGVHHSYQSFFTKAISIFTGQRQNEDHLKLEDYEGNEWPW